MTLFYKMHRNTLDSGFRIEHVLQFLPNKLILQYLKTRRCSLFNSVTVYSIVIQYYSVK